jgi:hypothetical protein
MGMTRSVLQLLLGVVAIVARVRGLEPGGPFLPQQHPPGCPFDATGGGVPLDAVMGSYMKPLVRGRLPRVPIFHLPTPQFSSTGPDTLRKIYCSGLRCTRCFASTFERHPLPV